MECISRQINRSTQIFNEINGISHPPANQHHGPHIDDILLHIKDKEQQLEILNQLFIWLRQHGFRISSPKSTFCMPEVEYLGLKINQDGVKPGTDHLKAIAATQPPQGVAEVKQFLGFCNFF